MNNFLADREKDIYSYVLDIGEIKNRKLTTEQKEKINQIPFDRFIDLFCCVFHTENVLSPKDLYEVKVDCAKVVSFYYDPDINDFDLGRPLVATNAKNFKIAIHCSVLSSPDKKYPYDKFWKENFDNLLKHAKNYTAKTTTATPATTETASNTITFSSKEKSVIDCYPQFEKDYKILLDEKIIEKTENGLHWQKSKQSLAEYFGYQENRTSKKNDWVSIEILFNVNNLANSLNGSKKLSEHYEWIKRVLEKRK